MILILYPSNKADLKALHLTFSALLPGVAASQSFPLQDYLLIDLMHLHLDYLSSYVAFRHCIYSLLECTLIHQKQSQGILVISEIKYGYLQCRTRKTSSLIYRLKDYSCDR